MKTKNYYYAIAILVGQIIGVGIFGLPFLISKAGLLSLFFLIVILGFVQYLMQLIYANIVIITPDYHQLPGYTSRYLGKEGKQIVFLASLISNYCALLAYTIVSGAFLYQLFSPTLGGSEFFYAVILFAIEATIVFFGVNVLARTELIMTGLLLLVVGLIAGFSFGSINLSNYTIVDWKYFIIPYGAMLFSLDGSCVIPFIVQLLNKDKANIKSAIKIGVLISAIVTAVFALVIVGVSGINTSPDGLIGIKPILNPSIISFALLFGILCMATSFLGSAQSLTKTFHFDYQINRYLSWFFAVSIPLLLYFCGINDLISVISFAGGVAGGLISIVLLSIVFKNGDDPNKTVIFKKKLPSFMLYGLVGMFVAGIIYEILSFILI